jgi:hypothetical protein
VGRGYCHVRFHVGFDEDGLDTVEWDRSVDLNGVLDHGPLRRVVGEGGLYSNAC